MKQLLSIVLALLSLQAVAQVEIAVGDTSGASRNTRAVIRFNSSGLPLFKVGSQNSKRLALLSDVVAAAGGGVQQVNGISPSGGNVTLTSTNVAEGSNQYFTQARARGSLSALGPLSLNASTGALTFSGTKSDVGLSNVDNTSDANKPISTAAQTALNGKEPTIPTGSTSQYIRGDKSLATLDKTAVSLGNVDNTSDVNKPVSTPQQNALNLKKNADVSVATYAAMNALTVGANSYTDVTVTSDEQYGETFSEYRIYALNDGVTHAKKRTIISEK